MRPIPNVPEGIGNVGVACTGFAWFVPPGLCVGESARLLTIRAQIRMLFIFFHSWLDMYYKTSTLVNRMKNRTRSADGMFSFQLNAHSGVPVYRQMIDQ